MKRFALAAMLVSTLAACKSTESHGEGDHAAANAAVTSVRSVDAPTEEEIAALFDRWNETLQTGGPHDMAMLYAEDGVLLATVSNTPRNNRPEIADYFVHFQKLSPRGEINEQYIEVLDSNTAVNSGVYTFDVVREGRPDFVVARFNFIYEKVGGKWLIKSHHSSAMPEPMEGRPQSLAERRGARVAYASGAATAPAKTAAAKSASHGEAHASAETGASHH